MNNKGYGLNRTADGSFKGLGDYRASDGTITRMLSEHYGVEHGSAVRIDLLALTQVAEFLAEAKRQASKGEHKRAGEFVGDAHGLLSFIIDDLPSRQVETKGV